MKRGSKIIIGIGVLGVICIFGFFGLFILGEGMGIGNNIAIIPVYGEISYSAGDSYAHPDKIKSLIDEANNDDTVKSIVLDINSPGGTPVASEELSTAVKNSKKPIVSWISDSGTSGAYMVASSSDKIVASPSSQVGSIGVILQLTDLSELYKTLGINRYALKAGEYKDMGAEYRNLTPNETKMLQELVDDNYDNFVTLVANNRNLSKSYVLSIADGKIYTGSKATEIRLVDKLGGKEDAVKEAAKISNINNYSTIYLTPDQSFTEMLTSISSNLGQAIGSELKGTGIQETSVNLTN